MKYNVKVITQKMVTKINSINVKASNSIEAPKKWALGKDWRKKTIPKAHNLPTEKSLTFPRDKATITWPLLTAVQK